MIQKWFNQPQIEEKPHDKTCDVDPKTLTWKRDIGANELISVCLECHNKIMGKRFKKGQPAGV